MKLFNKEPKWKRITGNYSSYEVKHVPKYCPEHGCKLEYSRHIMTNYPKYDKDTGFARMRENEQYICDKWSAKSYDSCGSLYHRTIRSFIDDSIKGCDDNNSN